MLDAEIPCVVGADHAGQRPHRLSIDVFDSGGEVPYRIEVLTGRLKRYGEVYVKERAPYPVDLQWIGDHLGLNGETIAYFVVGGGDVIRCVRADSPAAWWDVVSTRWEQLPDDSWPIPWSFTK
jgi:hypothetical protein